MNSGCNKNIELIKQLFSFSKSCLTLGNTMGYSPPRSSVHGISQTRILEWVVFPSPEDLPDPDIAPASPALAADSLPLSYLGKLINQLLRVKSRNRKQ